MEFDGDFNEFIKEKPKSKKRKVFFTVCFIIISVIVIWFIFSPFLSNKEKELTFLEQKVKSYLLDEQGYNEDEIQSIIEKGEIGSLPTRYVIVVFKNEFYVEYTYFAHNQVKQASYNIRDEEYKDSITEEDLKNFDPNGLIGSIVGNSFSYLSNYMQ
jgi:hypothetical protein